MSKRGITVSTANSSNIALAAGQEFVGQPEDIRAFPEATLNLLGAPSVAPLTLYFEYAQDPADFADPDLHVSVPYTLNGPQSFVPLPLRTVLPYFRIRLVNGATPQTKLRLVTIFHWEPAKQITRVINQVIDENEPVENVRAFIGAKSPDGPFVNTPANGIVSLLSSSTPLAADGVFTSDIVSTEGWNTISVVVKSDVISASNGIVFQFFADAAGTRLLIERQFTYGSAPSGAFFQIPCNPQGPYVRVVYTNGPTIQTTFELQTFLIVQAPPPDAIAISDTITGNNSAQIVKANVVGQQENGLYNNVGLSNSASVKVAVTDRQSEVRGRTRVIIPINDVALSGTPSVLYTVTPGRTLYISSFLTSALNTSANEGVFQLRDGTTNRVGFLIPSRVSGSSPSAFSSASPSLPEPLPFATDVNFISTAGTIRISGYLIGYEETN